MTLWLLRCHLLAYPLSIWGGERKIQKSKIGEKRVFGKESHDHWLLGVVVVLYCSASAAALVLPVHGKAALHPARNAAPVEHR